MSKIEFVAYRPLASDLLLDDLVGCYQTVFANDPWNEWKICHICNNYWGVQDCPEDGLCPDCQLELSLYWPYQRVKLDILSEANDSCLMFLAKTEGKVIGFCWGYFMSAAELDHKLELEGHLSTSLINRYNGLSENMLYHDEIGVDFEYRGQHIAKRLYDLFINTAFQIHDTVCVARTMTNPPSISNLWFKKLGFETVFHYQDERGRVIQSMPLRSLTT